MSPEVAALFRDAGSFSGLPAPVPPISEIVRHVYLGSATAAKTPEILLAHDIAEVVNCAKEIARPGPCQADRIFAYTHVEMDDVVRFGDAAGCIARIADAIHASVSRQHNVLVHCAMGVSRSASGLIYYLVRHRDMSLLEAATLVRQQRSIIYPNKGFWKALLRMEREHRQTGSIPDEALQLHSDME